MAGIDLDEEGGLYRTMTATLRAYWTEAEGYQKILYLTEALLLASAVFHAGVLVVTGGKLSGDVSFRKAITFGEAFGTYVVDDIKICK